MVTQFDRTFQKHEGDRRDFSEASLILPLAPEGLFPMPLASEPLPPKIDEFPAH